MNTARAFLAAFRLQLSIIPKVPDYLLVLATVPIYSVIFLSIVKGAGREDLVPHALIAPILISLWGTSLFVSGEMVVTDRSMGIIEGLVVTPTSLVPPMLGRVSAVTCISLLGFLETWLVGLLVLGHPVPIVRPATFLLSVALTSLAMTGTALMMCSIFALGRDARPFQRVLTYPAYVLGGILVPTSLLPDFLQPVSRLIFLSWAADLLRLSLQDGPSRPTLAPMLALVGLTVVSLLLGSMFLRFMLDRMRRLGTMTWA